MVEGEGWVLGLEYTFHALYIDEEVEVSEWESEKVNRKSIDLLN
jgi:hypothetical protein